jgi:hypothetical protein
MLQQALVALLVLAAALFAAWRLTPPARRVAWLRALRHGRGSDDACSPASRVLDRLDRLDRQARLELQQGCGTCAGKGAPRDARPPH